MPWILSIWDNKGQVTEVTNLIEVWHGWDVSPSLWKGIQRGRKGGIHVRHSRKAVWTGPMVDWDGSQTCTFPPNTAVPPRTQWRSTCQLLTFPRSRLLSFLTTACPQKHSSVAGHHHGAGELGPHCEHGRAVWAAWKLQVGGNSWPARKALTVSLLSWSPSTIPLTSQRWTGPCWAKRSVWTTVGAYLVIPASSSQTWHSCHSSFSSGHTPWPWPWRSSNSAVTSLRR